MKAISSVTGHYARVITSNVRVRLQIFRTRIFRRGPIRVVIVILPYVHRGHVRVPTTFRSSHYRASSLQTYTCSSRWFRFTIVHGLCIQVIGFSYVRYAIIVLPTQGEYQTLRNQGAHCAA